MKSLHVADGLDLTLEVAARTVGILAQKGAGKTYTALRITEELLAAGQQVVAMDPTGVWWGLRAPAAGGKGASFPVLVFGGAHADVPLEPTAGVIVARFAVESGRSLVLDLSGFESNAAMDRFAADFASELYALKRKATQRTTLHLMVDEADSFAPQRPGPAQLRMLGAFEAIVRRGRALGLGCTMISQRPAVLNKNVLSQIDLLIALRVVGPHDFKALVEWASMAGSKEQIGAFVDTLPKLQTGEAWFWSPSWLGIFQRAKVTKRVSFDSSRTPSPGEMIAAPKMAQVDLDGLSEEIQASAQRAEGEDPEPLKKRIRALERELQEVKAKAAPVVDTHRLAELMTDFDHHREMMTRSLTELDGAFKQVHTMLTTQGNRPREFSRKPTKPYRPPAPTTAAGNPVKLDKCQRAILTVLKQYAPANVEKERVALMTVYSVNGGGFKNALSSLRTAGLIEGSASLRITSEGEGAIGDEPMLPTGRALLAYWIESEGPNAAAGKILAALDREGGRASKMIIAGRANYEVEGGGFKNALSRLRTLKLISGKNELVLAEDLR